MLTPLLHVGPLRSSVALALSPPKRASENKPSRSPTLTLVSTKQRHESKAHVSGSSFIGREDTEEEGSERERTGKGTFFLVRTTGVAPSLGPTRCPSINRTKQKTPLSLSKHSPRARVRLCRRWAHSGRLPSLRWEAPGGTRASRGSAGAPAAASTTAAPRTFLRQCRHR